MGELQHDTYDDDCEGLTLEEVNGFYNFKEDREPQVSDENPEQSDEEQEEDSGDNYEEMKVDLELDIPGSGGVINLDHELDMEVHLL